MREIRLYFALIGMLAIAAATCMVACAYLQW